MSIPRESIWKLQNLLFAAGVAVTLGAAYAPAIGGRPWVGAVNGAVIGSLIAVIGIFVIERFQGRFLNRMNLAIHVGFTTLIWALVIIATLETTRAILDHPWGALPGDHPHNTYLQDVAFALAVGFLVSFVSRLHALIGMRTVFDFLIGKYASPVLEDRTVLILDLADSTTFAEKLGANRPILFRYFAANYRAWRRHTPIYRRCSCGDLAIESGIGAVSGDLLRICPPRAHLPQRGILSRRVRHDPRFPRGASEWSNRCQRGRRSPPGNRLFRRHHEYDSPFPAILQTAWPEVSGLESADLGLGASARYRGRGHRRGRSRRQDPSG